MLTERIIRKLENMARGVVAVVLSLHTGLHENATLLCGSRIHLIKECIISVFTIDIKGLTTHVFGFTR